MRSPEVREGPPGAGGPTTAPVGFPTTVPGSSDQALKDEPQPQVPLTLGLPNLKPEPCTPST